MLLLINIGTIAFIWLDKKPPHRPGGVPGGPAKFIIKELRLSPKQEADFMALVKEHRQMANNNRDRIDELREQLFTQLIKPEANVNPVALSDSIATREKAIDLGTYQHFAKVKALCDDRQKKHFDEIIKQILDMMGPPHSPKDSRPERDDRREEHKE